jgi:glycosyltransferase involved in cell wall biosynthesis
VSEAQPRLCIVGPLLGRNPGWSVGQGEVMADLLARDGYVVRETSRLPARAPRLADTAASLLRWSRQTDVVLVLVFSGRSFVVADLATWMAKRLGKPVILALHGGNLPAFAERHRTWSRRVLGRGDRLVAPSSYLAQALGALGLEVTIIPNVLEPERYPYRQRRALSPTLLWMRTFEDNYRPELAIEALAAVRASRPAASLTMAGQNQRGRLKAVRCRANDLGLGDCVEFVGFLDPAGKWRQFSRHDIFLNTTRTDNMPVSLLEAAACGLPIVSTSVGGIPFVFQHEQNALLVEGGDAHEMALAVERLLTDPELAAALSRNGRALAERCSWQAVRANWQAVFEELLARA